MSILLRRAAGPACRGACEGAARVLCSRAPGACRPGLFVFRGFFMLDQLRQGAQGWVSKLLMAVLVVSFGIWGVSGSLQGYHADQLAKVGNTAVSVQEFGRLYEQSQRNAQQSGRPVSPDQVLSAVMMN